MPQLFPLIDFPLHLLQLHSPRHPDTLPLSFHPAGHLFQLRANIATNGESLELLLLAISHESGVVGLQRVDRCGTVAYFRTKPIIRLQLPECLSAHEPGLITYQLQIKSILLKIIGMFESNLTPDLFRPSLALHLYWPLPNTPASIHKSKEALSPLLICRAFIDSYTENIFDSSINGQWLELPLDLAPFLYFLAPWRERERGEW